MPHSKLRSGMKNCTGVTLSLSSNAVGYFNEETNFQHKLLLLVNTQVLRFRKAFENGLSANIKVSKLNYPA